MQVSHDSTCDDSGDTLVLSEGPWKLQLASPLPTVGAGGTTGGTAGGLQQALAMACCGSSACDGLVAHAGSCGGGGGGGGDGGGGEVAPAPLLQWRVLLGDVADREVQDPRLEFVLEETEAAASPLDARVAGMTAGGEEEGEGAEEGEVKDAVAPWDKGGKGGKGGKKKEVAGGVEEGGKAAARAQDVTWQGQGGVDVARRASLAAADVAIAAGAWGLWGRLVWPLSVF